MSGVRGVLNYAGCFAKATGNVDRVNGWEAGLRDGLDYIHHRIIATLQHRKRPFSPSSLHRPLSHPGPISVTPDIYPANPLTLRSI